MERLQTVTLNVDFDKVRRTGLFFVQYDQNVYPVKILLRQGKTPFSIDIGTKFHINFSSPSGNIHGSQLAQIVDYDNGELLYNIKPYDLDESGVYFVSVKAINANQELTFQQFTYNVVPAMSSSVTIQPEKPVSSGAGSRSYIHLSIDDASIFIADLKANTNTYSSAFQNPLLGALKTMHDNYGACFSLYVYTQDTGGLSNKFASELTAASSWLKFGIHARNSSHTFATEAATVATSTYNTFVTNIIYFTGTTNAVDRIPRLHTYAGNLASMTAMRDCDVGLFGVLTAEPSNPDSSLNDRPSYYLTANQRNFIKRKGVFRDSTNGLNFYTTAIRTDWFDTASDWQAVYPESEGDIATMLTAWRKMSHKVDLLNTLEIFGHEWALNLITEFQKVCAWANDNNVRFSFAQDEGGNKIQISIT